MSHTLIRGGTIITLDNNRSIIKDGAVVVENDRIVKMGSREEICKAFPRADLVIDAKIKSSYQD